MPPFEQTIEGLLARGFKRVPGLDMARAGHFLVEQNKGQTRLRVHIRDVEPSDIRAVLVQTNQFSGRSELVVLADDPQYGGQKVLSTSGESASSTGFSNRDDEHVALAAAANVPIADQLVRAGFQAEPNSQGTAYRLELEEGELIAVTERGALQGLFVEVDPRTMNLPAGAEIVGASSLYGGSPDGVEFFRGARGRRSCLRWANEWVAFDTTEDHPGIVTNPYLLRQPTPAELGIPQDVIDQPGGISVRGVNDSRRLLSARTINGIPVDELQRRLQPGQSSFVGFLGENEPLLPLLVRDNDVVRGVGLTHQEIALPLQMVVRLRRLDVLKDASRGNNEFDYAGERYMLSGYFSMSGQESPFDDDTGGRGALTIVNMRTNRSVTFAELVPDMIGNYGFYEGFGTRHRLSPEDVIRTFTHLSDKAHQLDDVVASADRRYSSLVSGDTGLRGDNLGHTGILR